MNCHMCSSRNQEDIEWGVQKTGEKLGFKGRICVVDAERKAERVEREGMVAENRPWGDLHWTVSEWKKGASARHQGSRDHRRLSSGRKGENGPNKSIS